MEGSGCERYDIVTGREKCFGRLSLGSGVAGWGGGGGDLEEEEGGGKRETEVWSGKMGV